MTRPPYVKFTIDHLVESRAPCASVSAVFRRFLLWACLPAFFALALFAGPGCRRDNYLSVRKEPWNPLAESLELVSAQRARPTERTTQVLRRYGLLETYESDEREALVRLQSELHREPTAEKAIAFAELAYIEGYRDDSVGKDQQALDWYAAAVLASYQYLFDPRYDHVRNPYDPQFRKACDLYNTSLEGSLRILQASGRLVAGTEQVLQTGKAQCRLRIIPRGNWDLRHLSHFEFASDFKVEGLRNRYFTRGLGVPLIAVHRHDEDGAEDPVESHYPQGLGFAVTAFLRIQRPPVGAPDGLPVVDLELLDPLKTTDLVVAGRRVPMESDMTTPLGYTLDTPSFRESKRLGTVGLLFPDKVEQLRNIYLLEPYDPNKIPVLLVHGLWSTPLTWIDMFNDLRAFPDIRERYQFWFYLYPTAKPFWESAALLRNDLASLRLELDPYHNNPRLDEMVVVGHSMGGLLSRMQVLDSGDAFWSAVANGSFDQLKADPEVKQHIQQVAFFDANPSVRRVVTLATPHRGSKFANDWTKSAARYLIRLPTQVLRISQVRLQNPGLFKSDELVAPETSIDSLSPSTPFFKVLTSLRPPPGVHQHNVVGVVEDQSWWHWLSGEPGDGVVAYASAHLDQAESEIVVSADHQNVHRHPEAILEVRRILLQHLAEIEQQRFPVRSAQFQQHAAQPVTPWSRPRSHAPARTIRR